MTKLDEIMSAKWTVAEIANSSPSLPVPETQISVPQTSATPISSPDLGERPSVTSELPAEEVAPKDYTKREAKLTWIHLPANNVCIIT